MSTQAKNISVTIGGTAVADKLYNIATPNGKLPLIDDTNLASTCKEEIVSDLPEYGELKLEVPWNGADAVSLVTSGVVLITFNCFSSAKTVTFNGAVTEVGEVKAERDKTLRQQITVKKLSNVSA